MVMVDDITSVLGRHSLHSGSKQEVQTKGEVKNRMCEIDCGLNRGEAGGHFQVAVFH